MPADLLIAMPRGSARDDLVSLIGASGAGVAAADPADLAAVAAGASGRDAVVHVPSEDPFDAGDSLEHGAAGDVASIAADAGARLIFCSSVLLYADFGEAELMANDPELDPPAQLSGLASAELDVFGSRAELLLLRLGVVLAPGTPMLHGLKRVAAAGSGADGASFVPVLDRATLASALVRLAPSSLHGGWDLVSDTPRLEQLVAAVPAGPAEGGDDPRDDLVWRRSRRVTGEALRQAGAAEPKAWQDVLAEALA